MSSFHSRQILVALAALVLTDVSAAPVTVTSDLSFRTAGQSLFADVGNAVETEVVRFHVLKQQVGPSTQGRIVRTPTEIPVRTLQVIWQRAIDTCMAQSYTVPVLEIVVRPTEQECIAGVIDRCIVPGPFGTCITPFRRDLGINIGPRPTQPADRPYDIGVLVTQRSDIQVGFEGSYTFDRGSVDLDFATRAQITVDTDTAAAGDIVTIRTSHVPQQPFMMVSRYPFVDLALNMFAFMSAGVDLRYAGVDYDTGDQINRVTTLYSIDTRDNPDAIDGFVPFTNGEEELFGLHIDLNGVVARVLGESTPLTEAKYDYHLTWPPGAPETGKTAPRYQFPVSFSLADFSFSAPKLNTPAPANFDCGLCDPPLRSFNPGDGTITSTTPIGTRTLIGGITDGNGIVLPFVNEGRQDVDLARVDIDLDVVTAAAGVPLGIVVAHPTGLFEAEVNLLDLDLASFFSVDQRLHFDPNLKVELRFSRAVDVKGPQDTDFASVSSKVIAVGEQLQYRQPDGPVTITPVYTLRDNRFTNDTQIKVTPAIQETLGQVKLGGIIPDLAAEALGQDLNMALLQLTPQIIEPETITSTDPTPWAVNGFVDQSATPITVALTSTGPGPGPGPGPNPGGGGGGGGGGGAMELLTFLSLLGLVAMRLRRRPRHA